MTIIVFIYIYLTVKLLTENHLEFLSIKEGCTGSSESTFVKTPHCWKSRCGSYMYIWMHYDKIMQIIASNADQDITHTCKILPRLFILVWFDSLSASQQLWSCQNGQFY